MTKVVDFFKRDALGIPYWILALIILSLVCILIVTIIIVCASKKAKNNRNEKIEENGAPLMLPEGKSAESKTEVKEEKPVEVKPVEEEKPAAKTTAKSSTAKSATSKSASEKNEESDTAGKVYHISKRKEDNKWQVKAEGADRALRLFFTQADAIQYAKKVAGNQDGRIVVHKESGGFRKVNY